MTLTIGGVPAHPLVVHLAAVSVPLAALMCLAWVLFPARLTPSWRVATLGTTVVGAVSIMLARWTGEDLLAPLGLSESALGVVARHAQYATFSAVAALGLLAAAALFFAAGTERFAGRVPAPAVPVVRGGVAVAAVAALVSVVLVGHAGAQLAWADFPR
ncbi:hypothetical protein [Corynebacterium timonense]|uniref:Uncharacterized protein n=1 Tax=Corynebacterium timonense TaxID=441500 RepID=A0A1H1LKI8_9CORY|nr:hypothetical protein [Corynebacterium timonense]SDR74852.1 hypothetical protein SAMN04488539_0246 [Corynebacterium timonense]